ncbi:MULTISPECIES: LysR family transcriptional regulator [unclassified Rhodococcus (in: high G+C Gram-positive bacteria)]|uniref:LysR family transcriptional regulator n=1 Tax=unclassified Rhodococcus (in: high G+C Gram-positive bacteria) TaxID=192944 RepID=UPI00163A1B04|nr:MULTISPECIES: LysR family transcriptional regulator [unclassified Rhodococcus (in: high G+C Gram-positive bacteria)]MBC2637755.1 LysR family transcriptional regulator [Rhodococcus sp. 3A]MBC2897500.1 LysR family transcriptional regulator [Rhodococcus sp. 4CII]
MDLNLLVALEALLVERHVGRAGDALGITQSAMSNTLARLRKTLDDEILIRTGREWQLTTRAVALQEPLTRLLAIVREEVLSPLPFIPASSERCFHIATANAAAVMLVAPLVKVLEREAPNIRIQVVPIGEPSNTLLTQANIDLVLLPEHYGIAHSNQRLLSLEWVCLVDRDHPFEGERFDPVSFRQYPHVVYEHRGVPVNAQSALVAAGLGNDRIIVDDFMVIPFLVSGNHHIGVIQDKLAERVNAGGQFRTIAPPIELPRVNISMYWHSQNDRDPGNLWVRERLAEIGQQLNS